MEEILLNGIPRVPQKWPRVPQNSLKNARDPQNSFKGRVGVPGDGVGFPIAFFCVFAFGLPKLWGRIASVWKTVGELNFGWIPPEPNFPKSVFAKPIFPKSAYPKPILHPNQLFPLQNRFFPNRPIQNRIFPNRFLQNQFFLSRLIQNRSFTQINFFHNRFFPNRLSQINFSLNTWSFQNKTN